MRGTSWRADDESLLQRLEDERALEALFRHHVGRAPIAGELSARTAGLVASARALDGGVAAVSAAVGGRASGLATLLESGALAGRPPELLHHLALYFEKIARARTETSAIADAWTRALAAWLALGEEGAYLARIEGLVVGPPKRGRGAPRDASWVVLARIDELGLTAEASARDFAPEGAAALSSLARVGEAARIAGASEERATRLSAAATRRRSAAIDAALSVVGEALDEAHGRGEDVGAQAQLLGRALDAWRWSGGDGAVEELVAERLTALGWNLYQTRRVGELAATFAPFRPIIESFAARIEQGTASVAFAASSAQLFVFLTDAETDGARQLELAERAVRLCPTHRNARLNLASLLCHRATASMHAMVLFARKDDLSKAEVALQRAEELFPQLEDLGAAKALFERVKRGRIRL